jgi:hypothetical protein
MQSALFAIPDQQVMTSTVGYRSNAGGNHPAAGTRFRHRRALLAQPETIHAARAAPRRLAPSALLQQS